MTNYTSSGRLVLPVPGDPAVKNVWGTLLNANPALIEALILGSTAVPITGLASYSLTTANGAADQSRSFIQTYTGALTANCTVTLPNVPKRGWAQNSTTGGYFVVLSAGAGTTIAIPATGRFYWYEADGAGNVTSPVVASVTGVTSVMPGAAGSMIFSNGTDWETDAGLFATTTDVTASRVLGTVYTNSTLRPLFMTAIATAAIGDIALLIYVNGILVAESSVNTAGFGTSVCAMVPPGGAYVVAGTDFNLNTWSETT